MAAVQQLVGEEISLTADEKLMFNRGCADGQFKL